MKENDNHNNGNDSLFKDIAKYINEHKTNSPSKIGEYFSIGFNRANRIIRQIEEEKKNDNSLCRKMAE